MVKTTTLNVIRFRKAKVVAYISIMYYVPISIYLSVRACVRTFKKDFAVELQKMKDRA